MIQKEPKDRKRRGASTPGGFRRWLEAGNDQIPPPDILIVTSSRQRIPAHSSVLASASPVLESMIHGQHDKGGKSSTMEISILGVPCDAVRAFVCLLYSSKCLSCWGEEEEEVIGELGVHLLALSHAYGVGWLKRACERALSSRLTADDVVDVLVLARRCDAPRLHLRCMSLVAKDFAAVERTEAWRFLQENDPWLELDILQFLQDAHSRRRQQGRRKAERRVYVELQEAMECLRHIWAEGCEEVGPLGGKDQAAARPRRQAAACPNAATCRGLRQLIRHFAACDREKRRGCWRCKRLWQLLRLHASICDELDDTSCKVPLCVQFKKRMQQRDGEEEEEVFDDKWELLVKKVVSARVISHLAKKQIQHCT
ncbi:BTB/POZ and TAZ domain-containing protein 1-like [Canna indica]|uniref:BTB/POZ and TAZ domain-containing protein 1-like n=1 Tax=Canna indica TaxID=4628 RepID=A0AAQ3JUH7_9LILI|nr:BTB/POZ and TAZ domain-containing protein 1-like [Canna indica]